MTALKAIQNRIVPHLISGIETKLSNGMINQKGGYMDHSKYYEIDMTEIDVGSIDWFRESADFDQKF